MQALLQREGITPPVDVYVAAPRKDNKWNSHARSFPFLRMIPFLNSTDETRFNRKDPIWIEAYLRQGRSVFKDVYDCDYFLTWNGYLRAGKTLEEVDPDLACNWHLPRFISLKEENYRREAASRYGDYVVLYFTFRGSNAVMLRHFSIQDIAAAVRAITEGTGCTPVMVGAIWDFEDLAKAVARCLEVDLKTLVFASDLEELKRVLTLKPTYVAYEPPELIGSTTTSVATSQPEIIAKASVLTKEAGIPLIVGAGIASKEDVKKSLELGAVGVAVATDVVKAEDPKKEIVDLTQGFTFQ